MQYHELLRLSGDAIQAAAMASVSIFGLIDAQSQSDKGRHSAGYCMQSGSHGCVTITAKGRLIHLRWKYKSHFLGGACEHSEGDLFTLLLYVYMYQ